MVPASAAAGDGTLEETRGEARGEPGKPGRLDSVRDEARGSKSGKLDSVRDEVERGGSSGKRSKRSSGGGSSGDGADAVEAVGGILELIGAIAEASSDRPRSEVSRVRTVGPKEPHYTPGFLRFPYADEQPGYIVVDRAEDERRWFSLSARVDSGFTFGGLYHGGFAFDMQAWRIGFDTELTAFVEPPSPGFSADAMMLGSTSLRAALIMMPFIRVRIGAGGQYLVDEPIEAPADSDPPAPVGFDISADADVFAVRPMAFSFRIAKGRLGGLDTTKVRASVGVMIRRFELLLAYDFRRLGKVNLHGPGLGLRLWF